VILSNLECQPNGASRKRRRLSREQNPEPAQCEALVSLIGSPARRLASSLAVSSPLRYKPILRTNAPLNEGYGCPRCQMPRIPRTMPLDQPFTEGGCVHLQEGNRSTADNSPRSASQGVADSWLITHNRRRRNHGYSMPGRTPRRDPRQRRAEQGSMTTTIKRWVHLSTRLSVRKH
jgi:hypothetical protein